MNVYLNHDCVCRTILFKEADDVIKSEVFLEGRPVDWDSDIGQLLLRLLPPSTGQVNFRIAHEIGHLQHKDLIPRIVLSPSLLVLGYHFAATVCKCKWSLFIHSPSLLCVYMYNQCCVCLCRCDPYEVCSSGISPTLCSDTCRLCSV